MGEYIPGLRVPERTALTSILGQTSQSSIERRDGPPSLPHARVAASEAGRVPESGGVCVLREGSFSGGVDGE